VLHIVIDEEAQVGKQSCCSETGSQPAGQGT